jgi:hypothetical protein
MKDLKRNNMMCFIVGLVCFIIGFVVAAVLKDNINIGFGNQNITIIDGEVQHPKKDDLDEFLKKHWVRYNEFYDENGNRKKK